LITEMGSDGRVEVLEVDAAPKERAAASGSSINARSRCSTVASW
jgi:hypothetical protein